MSDSIFENGLLESGTGPSQAYTYDRPESSHSVYSLSDSEANKSSVVCALLGRPPPVSLGDSSKFTLFPDLPIELRLKIWEFSLPGPRKVALKVVRSSQPSRTKPTLSAYPYTPAMLHVNQESRFIALNSYQISFQNQCARPIYFDTQQDVIIYSADDMFEDLHQRRNFFRANHESTTSASIPRLAIFLLNPADAPKPLMKCARDVREWVHNVTMMNMTLWEAVRYLPRALKEVTIVHYRWDEEMVITAAEYFNISGTQWFLHDFEANHGRKLSASEMPSANHMRLADFEAQFD